MFKNIVAADNAAPLKQRKSKYTMKHLTSSQEFVLFTVPSTYESTFFKQEYPYKKLQND
jgi:hypothetical protein